MPIICFFAFLLFCFFVFCCFIFLLFCFLFFYFFVFCFLCCYASSLDTTLYLKLRQRMPSPTRCIAPHTLSTLLLLLGAILIPTHTCPYDFSLSQDASIITRMLNDPSSVMSCLREALAMGYQDVYTSIVDRYSSEMKGDMVDIFTRQISRLEQFEDGIVLGESQCAPLLKWGQNLTHVFVCIKMSHRWDSPPCLNTKHSNTSFQANTLTYSNLCVVSNHRINFALSLTLYADITDMDPQFRQDGVGIYSVILEKMEATIWTFLDKEQSGYPPWREIYERNETLFKAYQNLLEQVRKTNSSQSTLMAYATIIILIVMMS